MQPVAAPPKAFAEYRNFGLYRLLLALMVVLQHGFAALAPEPLMRAVEPLEIGSMAVLAFFALSGFVIIEAADTLYRGRAGAFMLNRLLRIFPHFLIAVICAMAIYGLLFHQTGTALPRGASVDPEQAFSMQNLLANLLGILPLANRLASFDFVEIAWAVRVEMAFYGGVALALLLCRLAARRGLTGDLCLPAALAALTVLTVPALVLALQGRGISLFQYLPYFVVGGAAFYWLRGRSAAALAILLLGLAGIAWHFSSLHPENVGAGFARNIGAQAIILAVLLAVGALLALWPSRAFERLDRKLGELTYPLYMHHLNVILIVWWLGRDYSVAALAAAVVLSLAAAWAMHLIIDPLADRLRDRIRGRRL